jgi:RHS repeat-associated protein
MQINTFGFRPSLARLGLCLSPIATALLLVAKPTQAQNSATLGIQPVATNQVQLSWQPVTGFEQVQRANTLGATNNWKFVTNAPLLQSPWLLLLQNRTNPQAFFRLANGSQPAPAPANLPNPQPTAPPPPNTQVSFPDAIAFLYTGSNAVQFGMAPGTIVPAQAAVLRGRVLTRSGTPLAGVHVFIPGQPAYGYTYSRADGMYDLAVNGGGLLTVDFQLAGYCPAQRRVATMKLNFGRLADVLLIPADPVATAVTLGSNAPAQWANSSPQTDANGSRSAQLYLPPGTLATMVMADGSTQAVSGLTVRMTELTVGTNGPSAMPAVLPPSSAYTYCADYTADEALAAGAQTVNFSQPLYTYVTNFLGFPVGAIVPAGYYDRARGCWVAADNGLIIQMIGVTNGLAAISLNTNGVAADAGTLVTNQFTTNELMQLAGEFPVGAQLTRVPLAHFTVWDFNFAPAFNNNSPNHAIPGNPPKLPGNGPDKYGTLRIAQQVFEETIPVVGAPLKLHYSSARVPDYRAAGQFNFPVVLPAAWNWSGGPPPLYNLVGAEVDATIAGITTTVTNLVDLAALSIQNVTVAWDKSWAYGTNLPGASTVAQIQVTFNYNSSAWQAYISLLDWWNTGAMLNGPPLFGQYGSLSSVEVHSGVSVFGEIVSFTHTLTLSDHRALGLGGWSLTPQHYYDPVGQILYLGDGTIRNSPPFADALSVAQDFITRRVLSVAPLSDGSCYVLLNSQNGQPYQIIRWFPSGVLVAVTGGAGAATFDGIAGTANSVPANGLSAASVALVYEGGEIATGPDDTVYFTQVQGGAETTIWHIDKQGLLRPVVQGGPYQIFQPDGTYGTNAVIVNGTPHLAVGPDGSVYYAENPTIQTTNAAWNGRLWGLIRRVGTDGRIYTIAGQGGPSSALFHNDFPGDGIGQDIGFGGPASASQLQIPQALCVGRDGSIYWITSSGATTTFILRVTPTGLLEAALDGFPQCWDGIPGYNTALNNDGEPAANVPLTTLNGAFVGSGLSQGPEGSLYFTSLTRFGQGGANLLWQLTPDGYVRRAGGVFNGSWQGLARNVMLGDNTAAAQAKIGPDGTLFVAADRNPADGGTGDSTQYQHTWQLLQMGTRTPTFATDEIAIASDDGSELYFFDKSGHHLRTLNTLTGTTNWLFGYDANNLVVSARDANGLVTTIQRDGAGRPQGIVSPYGQSTALGLDAKGFLGSVTDPASNITRLTNSPGGLLQSVTGPRGFTYSASYDALGRCLGAADPSGGSDNLGLQVVNDFSLLTSQVSTAWNISDTNSAGAASSSSSILQGNNTTLTETISPLNIINWQAEADNGDVALTNADGSVFTETFIGDPRFPSQTHLLSSATLQLPGGLTWQETASYAIATNSQTSLAMGGWTNLFSVNGNIYTDTFNGSNQIQVTTSPEGRQDTLQVDTQGRPVAEWQPGLATTTVSYDGAGRLGFISDQSAGGTRTSTLAYDSLGRLSLITDPLGRTNAFAYDAANQLQQLTLADGRVANYQHDAEDNITAITPPGRPAHTFNYDTVGQLTNYTPPFVTEDDSIGYAYDTQSQLTRAQFPNGQAILLNWNADGNLTNIVLGSEPTLSIAYSTSTGQLTNLTSSTGDAMGFTQQGALLSGVQWSGSVTGSVNIQFNNDLLPAVQTVGGASAVTFSYDGDLLLTNAGPMSLTRDTNGFVTATSAGMVQDARAYDDLGRMTNYSVTVGGSNFWSVALAYDLLDRITNKVESTSGGVSRTWQFAYDIDGRLSQVWLNGTMATTYSYDTNGNRLTRNTETATYDAQDRVQTYAGDNFTWSPNGMLTNHVSAGHATTYAWDLRSALASAALPDGRTVDYVLDGLGRRIGKKINGVLQRGWLYDGQDRPVAELNGSSVVTEQFVYSDGSSNPSLCIAGTNLYTLISDERGSIRFVINTADGTLAQALDYDEFGRVTTDSNPGFQPFGFGGGLYDPDTTLVRFGAREYLAETGQWAARDSVAFNGGSFSLYCYVGNDPVNLLDREGTGPYPNPQNLPVGQIGAIKSINQDPPGVHILRAGKYVHAREGMPVYIGDKIVPFANTATAIEFALGGAAAVQPDSSVTIINERQAREDSPDLIMRKLNIWDHVAHQQETLQIQPTGGGSIKG